MVFLQSEKLMSTSTSTFSSSPTVQHIKSLLNQLPTFLHTLYLFTATDFPTFAIPTTLFALSASLSGAPLTTNPTPALLPSLIRLPLALLVVWSNLLVFDISNQRSPSAISEDAINKPSRPLPSGRITPEATRRLLLFGIPVVLLLGWILGCWQETLLLNTAIWMYNDLQGCDEDWVLRNFLIALGYGLYSSAALRVMAGPEHAVTTQGFLWVGIVTAIMFVTQHICDIKDVEGDKVRGRKSAPIVLGDEVVRWTVAVPVMVCSGLCPLFFGLGFWSYVCVLGMGAIVAGRTMAFRDLKADKLTWKLWALWTCGLFVLPLVKEPGVFLGLWAAVKGMVCPGGECSGSLNLVAVSTVALIVEGRRLYEGMHTGLEANQTVPQIVVEGVVF